ncbi:hypothetical protein JW926_10365 [Candidatus Sumerlaeota bacterium]|nr:hypothetical protein [Candidatus Sumerlaeota bacterium]
MAFEDIKIIIKTNGEIWVDLGDMEPHRINHYKELFEEAIGPVKGSITGADGGGGKGAAPLLSQGITADEKKEKEQIKDG